MNENYQKQIEPISKWHPTDDGTEIIVAGRTIDLNKLLDDDQITRCPVCAYAIRKIALYRKLEPEDEKAKWQRYWLRHCLSVETDYIFQMLGGIQETSKPIDREDDVYKIFKEGLIGDNPTMPYFIGSDEGVVFYKKTIARWFLRRYNRKYAREVYNSYQANLFDKLSLYYVRLMAAILIGFLPLITQNDIWMMANNLPWHFILFSGIIFIIFSYIYLIYECNNLINNTARASKRSFFILVRGLSFSAVLSTVVGMIVGPAITEKARLLELKEYFIYLDTANMLKLSWELFGKDIVFFSTASLFIGIFIQIFWEEKTITEPL